MHRAKGTMANYLHTFKMLNDDERLSSFETCVHFQGKMGLVLRSVDSFCLQAHLKLILIIIIMAGTIVSALY